MHVNKQLSPPSLEDHPLMSLTTAAAVCFATKLTPILSKFVLEHVFGANELAVELVQAGAKEGSDRIKELLGREPALLQRLETIARGIAVDLSRGSDDNELLEPVLAAVQDTLESTVVDVRSLAQHNLNARSLAATLRQHKPSQLQSNEAELCDRILERLAERVIRLLWPRPELQSAALQELLDRTDTANIRQEQEDLAIERLDARLAALTASASRMERYYEQLRQQSDQATNAFEQIYRRLVVDDLDRMDLYGVSADGLSKRQPLSVAYIRLTASSTEREQSLLVDEALAGQHRVLIRGDPGSGKTTLLRWLAVRAALSDFDGPLFDWNGTVPIYVALRNVVVKSRVGETPDLRFPDVRDFATLLSGPVKEPEGSRWTEQLLTSGRALVLFDGVDEVPDNLRDELLENLHRVFVAYPAATFVVSTRPYALTDEWQKRDGFVELRLEDLTISDTHRLIDYWHRAVSHQLASQGVKEDQTELVELARSLKHQISSKPPLRDLARKPLLCAVLCALNRDRRGSVPEERITIYKACLEMLLSRRDHERKVPGSEDLQLHYTRNLELLQNLAYWFIVNGLSEAESPDVIDRLCRKLPELYVVGTKTSLEQSTIILQHLSSRSGVIREPVIGKIDWVHNTFKEFLAAMEAVNDDRIGDLLGHANEASWHEVIVFASGIATKSQKRKIFETLLESSDARLEFLAAQCLEVCQSLDPSLRGKVLQRIGAVIPPRSPEQARYVAAGGDSAIPFLSPEGHWSDRERCMSIEALGRIGTQAAIAMLLVYAKGASTSVLAALVGLWEALPDRELYARTIIATALQDREAWAPAGLKSLEGLQALGGTTKLTSIDLHFCSIDDISPLESIATLQHVNISDTFVSDVRPLCSLPSLVELNLRYSKVTNVVPLLGCRSLQKVDLTGLLIPIECLERLRAERPDIVVTMPTTGSAHQGTSRSRRRRIRRG